MRAMNIQTAWKKQRWMVLQRLVGTLKCRALHMDMSKVLIQSQVIPKVPRCAGSATHEDGESLGVAVSTAGFSIYFVDR
jgi:hypothetical protein